jgi:hypothetical protein
MEAVSVTVLVLLGRAAFHQSGFSLKQLFIEAAFHQNGFSPNQHEVLPFTKRKLVAPFIEKAPIHRTCIKYAHSPNLL